MQIDFLKQKIQEVAGDESYMGETIPLKWLKFEQEVLKLVEQGTSYASFDQVHLYKCKSIILIPLKG